MSSVIDPVAPSASGAGRQRTGTSVALSVAAGLLLTAAIFAGALPSYWGLVATAAVVTGIFRALREHLSSILALFLAVLLLGAVAAQPRLQLFGDAMEEDGTTLAVRWRASGAFDERLPIVLHLVFDEMMSTGAMPGAGPGGDAVRETVLGWADRHRLRVFDSVYSRYFFSGESLPNLMNAEYLGRTALAEVLTDQQADQTSNAYFDDMSRRGYRTAVFQSALMDFCANGSVDDCHTFDSFNPAHRGHTEDATNQTAALWQTLVHAYGPSYTSTAGQALLARFYGLGTQELGVLGIANRYDVQQFPAWFDRLAAFAANVPRGTHVFAHFMVPHSPYLLTENCLVSGRFEAGYYLGNHPAAERPALRQRHYESYLAQYRCVLRKLDELLTTLEASDAHRDALIIIHGDHGSRISVGNVLEDYGEQDFVDNYATFYAIRSPAAAAGVDCGWRSLPEVFRTHAGGADRPPGNGDPLPVIVNSRAAGEQKVEAPMPVFGCAKDQITRDAHRTSSRSGLNTM